MVRKSEQTVSVHFVAAPGSDAKLEDRLRRMGFENVKRLDGAPRVLLSATPAELRERLNIIIKWKSRRRTIGPQTVDAPYPEISAESKLPESIAELVTSFYTPPPPNI